MRLLGIVISSCLIFHAGTVSAEVNLGLKSMFDQYHYTLNVEWDQQDTSVPEQAKKELLKNLDQFRANGGSDLEIQETAISLVKNENLKKQLLEALSLSRGLNLSGQQAEQFTFDILSKTYNSGANWAGDETRTLLGFLIFIALIAALAVTSDSCPDTGTCYQCDLAYDECP